MKYFQIILILFVGGCQHMNMDGVDYLGVAEYYAVSAPHAECGPCCTLNPVE